MDCHFDHQILRIEGSPMGNSGMQSNVTQKGKAVGENLLFISPATSEIFGRVQIATPKQVTQSVRDMRLYGKPWAKEPVKARVAALGKLYRIMIEDIDEITLTITKDTGKPRQDALIELFATLNYMKTTLKKAPSWLKESKVSTGIQFFKSAYKKHKPYGVVAVISPWNYPLTLTMNPIIAALVTGNTVVVKPSEVTPAVGVMIESLFQRVPELKDCIRFVHGDGSVGAQLVNAGADLIYVTGSVRTGELITQAAAKTLTPVICELGGKDPMIVLDDADISAAVKWGGWGAFSNSGQTCMSPERVFVEEKVYDTFVEAITQGARDMTAGYSEAVDAKLNYGAITHPNQLNIVKDHIEDAVAKGARILIGGSHNNMIWQPTVIVDVTEDMLLLQEETFGAIMPIIKVKDEQEAIEKSNASDFGLSASVFSENSSRAKRVAEALEVGSVNINDTISHFGIAELPFGGVKKSGTGRANGPEGLLEFTYSVAYVSGKPHPLDITTKLREPGNYKLTKALMRLMLSPTLAMRLKGVRELF
jgi:acyl-CoA reductase-like NAD-dependent aldehyde dehydrogenase